MQTWRETETEREREGPATSEVNQASGPSAAAKQDRGRAPRLAGNFSP